MFFSIKFSSMLDAPKQGQSKNFFLHLTEKNEKLRFSELSSLFNSIAKEPIVAVSANSQQHLSAEQEKNFFFETFLNLLAFLKMGSRMDFASQQKVKHLDRPALNSLRT